MKRFLLLIGITSCLLLSPCLQAQDTDDELLTPDSPSASLHYRDAPNSPRPPLPRIPPDKNFDYVKTDKGSASGDDTQIEFGTTGKDKIIEYGGKGNATQYAEAREGLSLIY